MNEGLSKCPMCLTPMTNALRDSMGLHSYDWVHLPGKLAPMDVDFVLERKGHVLMIEFKPPGGTLRGGQKYTYATLVKLGIDVWLVQGRGRKSDDTVNWAVVNKYGGTSEWFEITVGELDAMIQAWESAASQS